MDYKEITINYYLLALVTGVLYKLQYLPMVRQTEIQQLLKSTSISKDDLASISETEQNFKIKTPLKFWTTFRNRRCLRCEAKLKTMGQPAMRKEREGREGHGRIRWSTLALSVLLWPHDTIPMFHVPEVRILKNVATTAVIVQKSKRILLLLNGPSFLEKNA
jgi:hypothetical protein